MRLEEVKAIFGETPSYYDEAYHLAIIEKRNGKFIVYLDLEGIHHIQNEILVAAWESPYDHGMIGARGEHNFKLVAPRLTAIRLFVGYPPRAKTDKPPKILRLPGHLEMAISLADAKYLYRELTHLADRVVRKRATKPIELPYGVSIEFIQDWGEK
jgi:hypothetical protein